MKVHVVSSVMRAFLLALWAVSLLGYASSRVNAQYSISCTEALASAAGSVIGDANATVSLDNGNTYQLLPDFFDYDARDPSNLLQVNLLIASDCYVVGEGTSYGYAGVSGTAKYLVEGPARSEAYEVTVVFLREIDTHCLGDLSVPEASGAANASTLGGGCSVGVGGSITTDGNSFITQYELPYTVAIGADGKILEPLEVSFANQTQARVDHFEPYPGSLANASATYRFRPIRIEGPDGTVYL